MELLEYLKNQLNLTKEIKEYITSSSETLIAKKGQLLMRPKANFNTISTSVLFIEKGLLRVYSEKKDKKLTMRFVPENTFTFSIERNVFNINDDFSWEALEDTTVRIFDYEKFETALDKFRDLEKFTRTELLKTLLEYQELSYVSRALSAEEKFNHLMQTNPDIFLRAPLGHIASYIGITPQVLSVMRSKKGKH